MQTGFPLKQMHLFVKSFTCSNFAMLNISGLFLFLFVCLFLFFLYSKRVRMYFAQILVVFCVSMFAMVWICKVYLYILADRWTNQYFYHWRKHCSCNCSSSPYFCHISVQEVRLTSTISNLFIFIFKTLFTKKNKLMFQMVSPIWKFDVN